MNEFGNIQGGLRREDFYTFTRGAPTITGTNTIEAYITKTRSYPQTVLGLLRLTADKYIHRRMLSSYKIIIKYKANGNEGVIKELSDHISSSGGGTVLLVTIINLFSIMFTFSAGGIELVFDRVPVYHQIAMMLLASNTLRNFFGKFWQETIHLAD